MVVTSTAATTTTATTATATKTKGTRSAGGPKRALNGMDALCTAAAMMADDDVASDEEAEGDCVQETSKPAVHIVTSGSDVVTNYKPVVSVQKNDQDKPTTVIVSVDLLVTSVGPHCFWSYLLSVTLISRHFYCNFETDH